MAGTAAPLVIFDLDGTLADTAADLMGALNAVLTREGISPLPVNQARTLLGAGGRALIERGFAVSGHSLDKERLESLFRDFLAHYEDHIADHSALFPGALDAMNALEAAGYGLAICTNKLEGTSVRLLKALNVEHRFRAICGQDTFGFYKPDARTLPAVVDRVGASAAVMIGDSITDVAAARNAGLPVIGVDFGYTDKPMRELGSDRVISHFDELTEAVTAILPAVAAA
jgi:phosphoglycolate phosphatase